MDIDHLIKMLKRARKSGNKPFAYALLAEDEEGHPALFVEKKLPTAMKLGKKARKTAKDKKLAVGRVAVDPDGNLVFIIDEGNFKPKVAQRAVQRRLAKNPDLKRVKGLLQKSQVMMPGDFESAFGTQVEEIVEDSAEDRLDAARAAAKSAYVAAREVASDEVMAELDDIKSKATAARKKGDIESAADLYEELVARCIEATEEEEDLSGTDDEELEEVDIETLHKTFLDKMDIVDGQIRALQRALRETDDDELIEIAEYGLNAVAGDFRVPLTAKLLDAKNSVGDAREAAFENLVTIAEDFKTHLENDDRVAQVDDNPFDVQVSVRSTLGDVLDAIIAAA